MRFAPPKAVGLIVGIGALILSVGVLALCAALTVALPPSLLTPFLVALALAALAAFVLAAYRLYGLLSARYVLSRNALVVEWGGRRELIPLDRVYEIHPAADFEIELRLHRLHWPGDARGRATFPPPLGDVEFLAAAEREHLILVSSPGGWLAISPSDPEGFLAAFAEAQAQGVETEVEPESYWPAVERWPLWRDWVALGLILAGGLGLLSLLGYLGFVFPKLPPQLALRFDAHGQPTRFGPPGGLFLLPAIGGGVWIFNTLASLWLHPRPAERPAAYLLLGMAVFAQVLAWVAVIGLLTAGP